jgi:sortase A
MGPGHYPGTPLPGEAGNVAIAGHRTTYGRPFYSLDALSPGAKIFVTTPQGFFQYRVTVVTTVLPWDTSVLAPTAHALLTLTTCQPRYSASHRLVARAVLARSLLFANQPRPTSATKAARRHASTAANTDLAGGISGGSWPIAVGWGLLTVAVAYGTWFLGRRSRQRWAVYAGGGVVVLGLLFLFFYSLSPLLPASF